MLRKLISDTPLEDANREELEKPVFLFSDSILISEEPLYKDECKGLCQISDMRMFITSPFLTKWSGASLRIKMVSPMVILAARVLTKMVLVDSSWACYREE